MEFDDFTNEVLGSIRKPRQPNYDRAKKIEHITSLDVGDLKDYFESIVMK
jgi:hypothetical protein